MASLDPIRDKVLDDLDGRPMAAMKAVAAFLMALCSCGSRFVVRSSRKLAENRRYVYQRCPGCGRTRAKFVNQTTNEIEKTTDRPRKIFVPEQLRPPTTSNSNSTQAQATTSTGRLSFAQMAEQARAKREGR